MNSETCSRPSTTCAGREVVGRLVRSVALLTAAAATVVSLAGPSGTTAGGAAGDAGGNADRVAVVRTGTVTADSATGSASAGAGSWGYVTRTTPAYERRIEPGVRQRAVDHVTPRAFGGIYAYCKAPLPNTSRFQYRAAIPATHDQLVPSYRVVWLPGGAMTFRRLTDIPRC